MLMLLESDACSVGSTSAMPSRLHVSSGGILRSM